MQKTPLSDTPLFILYLSAEKYSTDQFDWKRGKTLKMQL